MKQIPKNIALNLLRGYKFAISPWLGTACRYTPTCSDYAVEAIETYGVLRGGLMAAGRVLRCHPFGASGYDPVQERNTDAVLRRNAPLVTQQQTTE
jgi:putative membrane protein insertion efficiency factor